MTTSEIRGAVQIPLRFTTIDGQELPITSYSAVPTARLKHLETVAKKARHLARVHEAVLQDAAMNAGAVLNQLKETVRELEQVWDFGEP